MMRLALLPLLALLLAPARAQTPKSLADPDQSFDGGLYQEALKGYEARLKSPDEGRRLKALYRAVECEALLFRYAEAAGRSLALKLPEDPVWRGRFLLQRAEIAREFLKQYGYAAPRDAEEGAKDIVRRTPEEWHKEAREAFLGLWPLRAKLAEVPLSGEGYFVDIKDAETGPTPTLWDFAVLRWTGYLLDQAPNPTEGRPSALSFIGQDYAGSFSVNTPPAAQAAALMGVSGREEWRVERLLIPFAHPDRVAAFPDRDAAVSAAASVLKGWMDSFSSPPARARAGLEAAELLNGRGRYAETVELCRRIEKSWPLSRAGRRCAKLRAEIELPVLNLSARFTPPPGKAAFTLNTRNLDAVFFRLHRLDPRELLARATNARTGASCASRTRIWSPLMRPAAPTTPGRPR